MSNNNDIFYLNFNDDIAFLKKYLDDNTISDIMVNSDGNIFIKIRGNRIFAEKLPNTIKVRQTIFSLATLQNIIIDKQLPILETVIPNTKYRVEALLPPITDGPVLIIRKPTTTLLRLENYLNDKRITESQYNDIIDIIKNKYNILVAGGTGSGKTTFVNTLLHELSYIDPQCRLFIVEDTPELNIVNKDYVSVVTLPENSIYMLRVALRSNPDRIIFGELRHGDVAVELLKAFNSGHPGGITTIHANTSTCDGVLYRIYSLISEVNNNITIDDIKTYIDVAITIDVKKNFGPFISNIFHFK